MNGQISVGDTATFIISSDVNRKKVLFKNTGGNVVYIGSDNSVTNLNGFPLEVGESFLCSDYTGNWYGVCDSTESSTIMLFDEVI